MNGRRAVPEGPFQIWEPLTRTPGANDGTLTGYIVFRNLPLSAPDDEVTNVNYPDSRPGAGASISIMAIDASITFHLRLPVPSSHDLKPSTSKVELVPDGQY